MKPKDLIAKAQLQIDLSGDDAEVALVMRGRIGKTGIKRLLGVKGECVQELPNGEVIVMFPAKEIIDAVNAEFTA